MILYNFIGISSKKKIIFFPFEYSSKLLSVKQIMFYHYICFMLLESMKNYYLYINILSMDNLASFAIFWLLRQYFCCYGNILDTVAIFWLLWQYFGYFGYILAVMAIFWLLWQYFGCYGNILAAFWWYGAFFRLLWLCFGCFW